MADGDGTGNPKQESPRRFKDVLCGLGNALLDLFLPRRCAGCRNAWMHSREGFWCEQCLAELPWITHPLCPRCGRPYPKSAASPDHPCGDCLLSTYPFDSARSATLYSGVVRDRIHQLKFGCQLEWTPALTELLADAWTKATLPNVHLILPVPLHLKRLRERGFNQSGLLAKALGKRFGVPFAHDLLRRERWTEPQTRLSRKERLTNVKGAFYVTDGSRVEGLTIVLIDDVFTTRT
jgi:ComF family protein